MITSVGRVYVRPHFVRGGAIVGDGVVRNEPSVFARHQQRAAHSCDEARQKSGTAPYDRPYREHPNRVINFKKRTDKYTLQANLALSIVITSEKW